MKAIILAGGGGTRLWPLSTEEKPKQFHKLTGEKTMIEETIDRLDFLDPEDIYIAINAIHLPHVKKLCPQIPEKNIIIEPDKRDTASAMGFAACIVEHRTSGEVMAMISADHIIHNKKEFQEKLKLAEEIAQKEKTLNIIEVEAKEPNINYGYVKLGANIEGDVYHIDSFVEKPDKQKAEEFIKSGNYLWNTGIYVWRCDVLLNHFKQLKPETYEKFTLIMESLDTDNEKSIIQSIYPTLEKISIDFAIMENVNPNEIRIIKADLGWKDIGNWNALYEELYNSPTQKSGEIEIIKLEEAKKFESDGKRIKTNGSTNIIVIQKDQKILIARENQ